MHKYEWVIDTGRGQLYSSIAERLRMCHSRRSIQYSTSNVGKRSDYTAGHAGQIPACTGDAGRARQTRGNRDQNTTEQGPSRNPSIFHLQSPGRTARMPVSRNLWKMWVSLHGRVVRVVATRPRLVSRTAAAPWHDDHERLCHDNLDPYIPTNAAWRHLETKALECPSDETWCAREGRLIRRSWQCW